MAKFAILGGEVLFSQPQLQYVELRKAFQNLKEEVSLIARGQLFRLAHNVDELPAVLTGLVSGYLQKASELAVERLCGRGVYDIDEASFQQRLVGTVEREGILNPLLELGTTALEIEDIRGGGGVGLIGGGFGLEGAARGVAVAGAVNLLTSAFSSAAASAKREAQRQAIAVGLRGTDQIDRIVGALNGIIDCALSETAKFWMERSPEGLLFPSAAEADRAKALAANLAKGRVPADQTKALMLQALELNPYDPLLHVLVTSKFPDSGIEALSDFLGIDVSEYAGKEEVKAVLGSEVRSLSYWSEDLLSIFRRFPNKHLHVFPHIPERKLTGACKEYFREGVGYPEGMSAFRLIGLGEAMALIDTTVFGGGGCGITFSTSGFAWKETADEPRGLQWVALRHLDTNLQRTIFGVRLFGSEIQLSGVDITKQRFSEMMFAIRDQLALRDWKT